MNKRRSQNKQPRSTKQRMTLGAVAAAALALSACGGERQLEGYDEATYAPRPDAFFGNVTDPNMDVQGQALLGSLGPVRDFNHDATARGYSEEDFAQIDLMSSEEDGSTMQAVTIFGDIHSWQPGFQNTFTNDASQGDTHVSAIVCSGTEGPGMWSYDQEADAVTVSVQEADDPAYNEVTFVTHSADNDVSTGSVLVAR